MCPTVPFIDDAYVRRVIDDELDQLLPQLPAVLLDGPKGVGKTATASRRCATVRRLDEPAQLALVQADASLIANDPKPLLIDEWHRHEPIWNVVRHLVDDEKPPGGSYLLTGSSPRAGTHSGAARIVSLRMRPLAFGERRLCQQTVSFAALADGGAAVAGSTSVGLDTYVDEILASGFPGLRRYEGRALTAQLDGYVERIVDHDLPEAGFTVRRPATVLAWLRAYAAATATTASWDSIRDAATSGVANKPAKTTTIPYVELLTALRVLDEIPPWAPARNQFSRLGAAPKHHLADPALAARLLEQTKQHLLTTAGMVPVPNDGTLLGNLFESLVALSVRTYAQALGARVFHLRMDGGRREVDFIIEVDGGVIALEVKLSAAVSGGDVRHLLWLRDQIGDRLIDFAVITTGPDAYRRPDGVAVIPLALLGP